MLWFEHGILTSVLGEKPAVELEPNWTQVYGTAPEPRNAPRLYKPKAVYLSMLDSSAESAVHAILQVRPEMLEQRNPNERLRSIFPTTGTALTALCTHRSYHLGQLAIWRKIIGLPHAGL